MFKKSFFLGLLVLFSGVMPAKAWDLQEFINSDKNIGTKVAVACGVVAAVVIIANWLEEYNAYCKQCAFDDAKKLINEADASVGWFESLAAKSLEQDLVAKINCSDYPLCLRGMYNRLMSEGRDFSRKLVNAKQLLASRGERVFVDGYVCRLNVCEEMIRIKLAKLYATPIFQNALDREQAEQRLRLERQRLDNERRERIRRETAHSKPISVVNVTSVNVKVKPAKTSAKQVNAAPAKAPAQKNEASSVPAKVAAEPEKVSSESSHHSTMSQERLDDLCDQAYNG